MKYGTVNVKVTSVASESETLTAQNTFDNSCEFMLPLNTVLSLHNSSKERCVIHFTIINS